MRHLFIPLSVLFLLSCSEGSNTEQYEHGHHHADSKDSTAHHHHAHGGNAGPETTHYEKETHLKNVRQLTYGGDNAEAYWSFDDQSLVFQSNNPKWGYACDQIYVMPLENMTPDTIPPFIVSTGKGRTTCSYFMPGDSTIIYGSTHLGGDACPEEADRSSGRYVWSIYDTYDLFVSDMEGNIIQQLTDFDGYDAEATLSSDGSKIVFTSTRSGDLELWTMNVDGSDLKQITFDLGYDGGAFFSPDGTQLVYRSSRPKTPEEVEKYTSLLAEGLVEPSDMELYVCDVDGTNHRQVTSLGGANWAPFFHPSGEKILFCSNHHSGGYPFNLFMINVDGTGLEQVTFDDSFDSFPMFSYDGKHLVFASNRNNGRTRDTNLFIAEWQD